MQEVGGQNGLGSISVPTTRDNMHQHPAPPVQRPRGVTLPSNPALERGDTDLPQHHGSSTSSTSPPSTPHRSPSPLSEAAATPLVSLPAAIPHEAEAVHRDGIHRAVATPVPEPNRRKKTFIFMFGTILKKRTCATSEDEPLDLQKPSCYRGRGHSRPKQAVT